MAICYLIFGLPEAAILTFYYYCLGGAILGSPFFSSSYAAAASMKPLGGGTGTSLLNGFAWVWPPAFYMFDNDDYEPSG